MKISLHIASLFVATATMFSCAENTTESPMDATIPTDAKTRVGNEKQVMVYVETNDINPLNALTYVKTGTDVPFIDILNLFAANINKDASGNPTIYFNPELAPIMANMDKYVRPLQDAGIKVNLSLLPAFQQGIGPANLTPTQATNYARLVAYVVYTYDLDGITIDDEYAGYASIVSCSFANLIKALRAEFDARGGNKLISVFQWGNIGQIDSAAGAMLDYVDNGNYSPTSFGYCNVAGVPNSKFMPVSMNLGNFYSVAHRNLIRTNARKVATIGYAGAMGTNLRNGLDVNAQPVFNAWAQGFAGVTSGTLVTWNGVDYPQDQTFIPGGYTITNTDVPANF
jgi:hypothetical protein